MALLKWITPKVVRRHELRTSIVPFAFWLWWIHIKWVLLLGLPSLYAVWRVDRALAHGFAHILTVIILFLTAVQVLHIIEACLARRTHSVDSKGLLYAAGKERRCIYWHQMQSWTITDHPRISGIRVLTVNATLLRRPRTLTFPFNPRTVDETRLRQMFAAHVRA